MVRPIRLTTEGDGLLTCQLQVRSHRPLEIAAVNQAIMASSEISGGGGAAPTERAT
jgi:hypothetical protein